MTTGYKILTAIVVVLVIGIIYWIFTKNKNSNTNSSSGTGITPKTTTSGNEFIDNGRFIKPKINSTPRSINGLVNVQVGCEGKGFYNCNAVPTDCSQSTLNLSGCTPQN